MDLNKFELAEFQIPGYKQLVTQFRHLLLYAMGLGKTVVGVKAMYDVEARCILIICPRNAIKVWENHIREWFDGLDIASGKITYETETTFHVWRWRKKAANANLRRLLWRSTDRGAKVNIYVTTYAAFVRDIEHFVQRYDLVIIDEAKRIRNRKSQAFIGLKPLCKAAKYVWPMTGTPGRLPMHFWTMFNLIDPKNYGSYWRFVEQYHITIMNQWNAIEVVGLKNQDSWFDLLRRKATILTKKDIGHTETIRQMLYADLDEEQERLYREMEQDMMMVIGDKISVASTSMTQVLRYRQLLVCPRILGHNLSVGGAFTEFVDSLKEGDRDPHDCVIFTPFTEAFPHFESYLKQEGFQEPVFFLQGGLDPDEQQRLLDSWRKSKGIIFCSILYATSFSLEPAKEAHFFGYDWDPENNEQAEERLNRLTTKYPVNSYYWVYEDTFDERQCEMVNFKQKQANKTLPKSAQKITIDLPSKN